MGPFDLVVIGGGVTGAGVFRDAARAGLKALLLEAGPPGGRTTSVSSGLLHGGLRYLPYDASTSRRSSREAGTLALLYPGLVRRQPFLWPVYRGHRYSLETVETLLELYDELAGARGGFLHLRLTPREALAAEPGLRGEGLLGALAFDEWAVDAPALVRALVEEGTAFGGEAFHGCRARALETSGGKVAAVRFEAAQSGQAACAAVVNAAGPWAEDVARLAGVSSVRLTLRRGTHLVVPGRPSRCALIFPDETGRHVGLYPRGEEAWIGPTDEPMAAPAHSAAPEAWELTRLRRAAQAVLPGLPEGGRGAAGARPILRQALPGPLSREFKVFDHARDGLSNLVTVTGGKLTIFRPMARQTLALVCEKLGRRSPDGVFDEEPARGRLTEVLASAAGLAAARLRHALSPARPRPAAGAEFARRYAAP